MLRAQFGNGAFTLFTPGHVISERYRVRSELGEGSGGEVYEVLDLQSGAVLALKIQQPRYLESTNTYGLYGEDVHHEFALGASLGGISGVVTPLDFGDHLGRTYFVMERVDGFDLGEFVGRSQPVSSIRSAAVLVQLCTVLHQVHSRGFVHRDIKLENALISRRGVVTLIDLGSSVPSGEVPEMPAGTFGYLAPEAASHGVAETSLDIFSAGCLLFRMLTMEFPFLNETGHVMARRPLPVDKLVNVDPVVQRVCVAMLEWDPADRPTAAEVRDELIAVLPNVSSPVPPRLSHDPVRWWWEQLQWQEHAPMS
ncbi:serine/threonine-protein kinase [Saccharothrix australiensis]|uniref:Serine/threonine-protein kinase n=1 Tax=Saccharothrix australiensis TaxID=2072 RepID=A0A495VYT5_9PSEU|nr:serine/threonine-protein kinase [Saccharothrix australiensis]RKT53575.1 serine/threonine-protein kinase [Saccharothrix australiensis]